MIKYHTWQSLLCITSGLSCSKFGASGLSRRQITLRARLINNKLGGGDCQKNKKFFNFLVITSI